MAASNQTPPTEPSSTQAILPNAQVMAAAAAIESYQPPVRAFRPGVAVAWSLGLSLVGAAFWALVTYATNYQLGIIAIVLGILAGKGAARGGRGRGAQIVGASCAAIAFFAGQLMVVLAMVAGGNPADAALSADQLVTVIVAIFQETFTGFDVVFLAFAVWEGYRIPQAA